MSLPVWTALATLALVACRDHPIAGSYVGAGHGSYQLEGGPESTLGGPGEVIEVKQTSRHYQASTIEVRARDCVVRSESGGDEAWSLTGECAVARPDGGQLLVQVTGGLSRERGAVHLSLHGGDEKVRRFQYIADATPRP